MAWTAEGLVCAPRLGGPAAARALADCPFAAEPITHPGPWPDSVAALVAGWYRRSDQHAPAPAGVRELIQVAGDGFGPADHPTTAMCLAALDLLPAAAAVDVGCGSGLLTQAWVRRWSLPVLAIDLDPAAIAQTRASLQRAACSDRVEVRRQPVQGLSALDLTGRVVFANIPVAAHAALLARYADPPRAVVVSGLRPDEAPDIVRAYRRLGLRHTRAARRGRFDCHVLVDRG
jgi:ribosomal protein L11 methyltransferase